MKSPLISLCLLLSLNVAPQAHAKAKAPKAKASSAEVTPDLKKLTSIVKKFESVDLTVDISKLPENEKKALAKIILAAKAIDPIYLRQIWSGSEALQEKLSADQSTLGQARLAAFQLEKSPWSSQDDDRSMIPGVPKKPEAGSYYPEDATKKEIEDWQKSLPAAQAEEARGFFTVIRRGADGKLKSVPYSQEYEKDLKVVATYLKEAAALTQQPTLKTFLESRAAALFSNNYYDSDVAWMKLDASIEPTIGPYETYSDGWFNAKAAFEAYVATRDDEETAKLAKFSGELQDLENNLPIDAQYRNPKIGALAPIRVVNSIFSSGEGNRGVQTAAFNLPNDERIAQEMGTKRVMLKNIQQAKFDKVLLPISAKALSKEDQGRLSFDAFFTHILMHELMHGLGPSTIKVGDKTVTIREKLQEHYSAIEESKADISGLWALQRLIDKGVLDKDLEKTLYTTYLASSFRSIRFGLNEAHGKGVAVQINYLLDAGAYTVGKDGSFAVNDAKIKDAIKNLTTELLTLQAKGDKAKVDSFMKKYANFRPSVKKALDRMTDIPVDIKPVFKTADELLKAYPG